MDRNNRRLTTVQNAEVALRKESVDRNLLCLPSSLRLLVALRKESVDRNAVPDLGERYVRESLSARRAWIEIMARLSHFKTRRVALRKESVDRNVQDYDIGVWARKGRSPQGERG